MAAHLQRYGSELVRVQYIIDEIKTLHESMRPSGRKEDEMSYLQNWSDIKPEIIQLQSQANAVGHFRHELERKTENILALVSAVLPI
jgi:hypothetical protein